MFERLPKFGELLRHVGGTRHSSFVDVSTVFCLPLISTPSRIPGLPVPDRAMHLRLTIEFVEFWEQLLLSELLR